MIAVAFPGQGAQKVPMPKMITANEKVYFFLASEILGYDLWEICQSDPKQQLSLTQYVQPALLVTCISKWKMLATCYAATYFAGHSLGTVIALVAAGAIDFLDAVKIVAKRGQLMAKVTGGVMVAVIGLSEHVVEELCLDQRNHGVIAAANYNSPGQIVVSGERLPLEHFCDAALAAGAKRVINLPVSGPFHTELMGSAASEFADFLAIFNFAPPKAPVISNQNNVLITQAAQVRQELVCQLTEPVRWTENIHTLHALGVNRFVEIGPSSVLVGLVKRTIDSMKCEFIEC